MQCIQELRKWLKFFRLLSRLHTRTHLFSKNNNGKIITFHQIFTYAFQFLKSFPRIYNTYIQEEYEVCVSIVALIAFHLLYMAASFFFFKKKRKEKYKKQKKNQEKKIKQNNLKSIYIRK